MRRPWWQYLVACMAVLAVPVAHAQQSLAEAARAHTQATAPPTMQQVATPAATLEDALHGMFAAADVVFTGTVTRVQKSEAVVTVHFRVDDGIRGVATGATYTLREWSGLWADDPTRYAVGERRLMLLHAASPAGYASPVAGSRGSIRLHGNAAQCVADLRWVATDVLQAASMPSIRPLIAASQSAAFVAQQDNSAVDGAMLSGMLHAWHRSEAAR